MIPQHIKNQRNKSLSDLPMEIWKDIEGYEGLYKISNLGRVKSLERTKRAMNRWNFEYRNKVCEAIHNANKNPNGYYRHQLSKNGKNKIFSTHRLMAIAFIPNVLNKPHINHINGIRDDNRIENLEWCTQSENIKHAFKIGNKKPTMWMLGKKGVLCCNSKPIIKMDLNRKIIERYDSASTAGIVNKISDKAISNCARGITKTSGGFKWEYV